MKPRHTLGLFLLLAALCAGFYGMRHYNARRTEEARVAKQVFSYGPEAIERIIIDRIDEPAFAAERTQAGPWRITEPNPTIRPFTQLWDRLATHLADLSNEHTVLAPPFELAPYGLDAPALTLTHAAADGKEHVLEFGDLEPTQRHRYARLNGGDLFLVKTDAFFELNRSLLDMRHRFLVDDREADILELEFAWFWTGSEEEEGRPKPGQESVTVAVRRENVGASWRLVAPVEGPANHEAVQALVDDVRFAVCGAFIDAPEDLSDYGLDPPRARITVKDAKEGRRQTILLGGVDESPEKKGVFAKQEGQDAVLIIDGHLLTLLPQGPFDWRDRRLLTRRVADLNRIEYATEHDGFTLEKQADGEWRLAAPSLDHVNHLAVSGFLRCVKEVEGDEFVEGATSDMTVAARIVLRYDDGSDANIVVYADPEKPDAYLASQDSGSLMRLSNVAAMMLLIDSEAFRSREMQRFTKAEVEEIEFTFEGTAHHLLKRHDQWTLQAPPDKQLHNQSDVDTLLSALTPIHALSVAEAETPADLAPYGLDAPVFAATLVLGRDSAETPAQRILFAIGAANPANANERYASSSARPGIFLISQEVMDQIREALRGIY